MSRLVPGRPTLGVLLDWLEDVYQNTVFSGILAAAEAEDVNVVCFAGGVLGARTAFGERRNHIYSVANPRTVDGIVLLSGTVGNHVGPQRLAAFCSGFEGLPVASLGIALPGFPSFLVDNAGGMAAALAHLIDVHARRRIAFVRGPEANGEAEARFEVYRQVLEARGLPFDPSLVAPGDFRGSAGVDALRLLLDERRCEVDAVVAANDHMALGVLAGLRARRVHVPRQISVIGFDDVEDARLGAIPLATVRQPLWLQGRLAAQNVIDRVRGCADTGGRILRPEFVARVSCGCDAGRRAAARPTPVQPLSSLPAGAEQGAPGLASAREPADSDELLAALLRQAKEHDSGSFLTRFEDKLEETSAADLDTQAWHRLISGLRVSVAAHLDGAALGRAFDLLDEARLLISSAGERSQGKERLRAEQWLRSLRSTGEGILATFDMKGLAPSVAAQLPALGIPACYLATFDSPKDVGVPARARLARLLVAYDEAHPDGTVPTERVFPADDLLPPDLLPAGRRFTFVVEPLFFEEIPLGYVVAEMGPKEGVVYEALRSQLSTAIKGARLVAQIIEEGERREEEERRAGQALKLESVGRLAAGIAHEINTPIQYVRDSVHFARDSIGDLSSLVARYQALRVELESDPTWRARVAEIAEAEESADVAYLMENIPNALERSLDGLERVATIVRSIKEFAHPDSASQATADINQGIENTLVIARNEYKYVADVETDFGSLPPVMCHLGELNQVILNIVVNAAHAIADVVGETGDKGLIRVRTWREGDFALIAISDTGTGIPASIRARIFDPFFTTKEVGRGTGQGLAIAHTVIAGKHGGTLTFETEMGKGTTFCIRLPIDGRPAESAAPATPAALSA